MITALTDPNQLPNQLQDQQTFDANMAYVIDMLPERARQENELAAEMAGLVSQVGVIAAGGAFAIPYVFDASTTDADPGAGKLRLSSATQNAATVMRLDLTSAGQDYTTLIDTFDDSTSAVKGSIRLVKQGDITKWMTFNLTALAAPAGYRNLTVVCTDSSAASPFANGDPLMLSFQRTGDKGQDAVGALQFLGAATVSTAVAQIDFLNIFSATYDRYVIEVQHVSPSASQQLWMRMAVGGVIDASAAYRTPAGHSNAMSAASAALALTSENTTYATLSIQVRNANLSTPKGIGVYGGYFNVPGNNLFALSGEGAYTGAAVSGFRLYWQGGANFTGGIIRVYGIKNS